MSWSPDARVLVSPARAYRALAANPEPPRLWTLIRRPLFFLLVFGCLASITTSGGVTARLLWSVPLYWSFVPLAEIAGLLMVTWSRREQVARSSAIDLFLTGHAAWTLYLMAVAVLLSSAPAGIAWQLLTTVMLAVLAIVIAWSAYVDYCFFRSIFQAGHRRALRDTALVRVITWPIVFIIFAVPALTPWAFLIEIREALREVF